MRDELTAKRVHDLETYSDPHGIDCWCRPCGSYDCHEFGPSECAGRDNVVRSLQDKAKEAAK
jgi:hypothetical protein